MKKMHTRMIYSAVFAALLAVEILIALFVRDSFIRPYGGDILVTALICAFVRIFFPTESRLMPLWVFLFAAAVELGQYFDFVALLGLDGIKFFRILLGSTFSIADILCYAAGCLIFFICESALRRQKS